MPFGRVGIGCDSLSSAALQIKSQEPSLRGKIYKPPVSPGGGTSSSLILSRSVLLYVPHTSSEGSLHSETVPFAPVFVPHIVAPVTDSPRGIPIGMFVSGLAIPVCARAGSFRLRDFRGVAGAQGLRLLIRSNLFAYTCSTSLPRRPDSYDSPALSLYCYSWLCASGGKTILPSTHRRSVRRLPRLSPCLLAVLLLREMSANAATPERAKPPSHPILTHASAYCQEGPASPARS